MPDCTPRRRRRQIETLRAQFAQADEPAFADVLPAERVERALREEGAAWRHQVYTPAVTLWAFLTQVTSPDGSCRAAVARALAWLVSRGRRVSRPATGPYCKARARLPEALPRRLARETGRDLHRQAEADWLWQGRRVKVADGTTVSMPDTAANQRAYPQPDAQQPGLGFPIARAVVVFCLATGAALDAALGRYRGKRTGAAALLREVADGFEPGDVVLGDRGFGGFFDLALWRSRGVDAVVRLHQARRADFRAGRRLGPKDHVVRWARPDRPGWLDEATYASLAQGLEVREVEVRVSQPGFRTRRLVVATTLLDADRYPARALAALYRARWHAELDLRSLKVTLGLDVLRCRTPAMVRKEFWAHLLAYNLIRAVLARAALDLGALPRGLSFKGALQATQAFAERLLGAEGEALQELYDWLVIVVASHQVGDRPDRVEPRKRKRRPKHYPNLTQPRAQARKATLAGR
jgi:DDE family transposase